MATFTDDDVKVGRLWLRTVDDSLHLHCFLGPDPPKVVGGRYGGWQIIDRPRKVGITEWQGSQPLLIEISFMIDAFAFGEDSGVGLNTEKVIRVMERMAGLDSPGDKQPPLLYWTAHGPHDHADNDQTKWFIETLEWDDALANSVGNRTRQPGKIQLRQYVSDDLLKTGVAKNKTKLSAHRQSVSDVPKTHKVRKGETLQSIAAKYLGSSKKWKELAKLNHIRDPRHPPVNKTIKLRK